jgi:hypothetical protein
VVHKGFPSARSVVEIIMEICNLRREDLTKELSVWQKSDFMSYIRGKSNNKCHYINWITVGINISDVRKICFEQISVLGLKIDYMLPNVPTSKRTYKVNNIVKSAVDQR